MSATIQPCGKPIMQYPDAWSPRLTSCARPAEHDGDCKPVEYPS